MKRICIEKLFIRRKTDVQEKYLDEEKKKKCIHQLFR